MTASSPPDATGTGHRGGPRLLVAAALGLPLLIALMLFAFGAPAVNAGARDLPLAVSGPPARVAALTTMIDREGDGMFDVTTCASAGDAAEAIRDRDAIGGIAVTASGVTVQTASAAGGPYAPLLRGIGAQIEASGQPVVYEELAPLTADDASGAGLTAAGLPLIFGGMASAALMLIVIPGAVRARVAAALAVAVLGGLAAAAMLRFVFGTIDGGYLMVAVALALGIAAIALPIIGLGLFIGPAGIGVGALLFVFVANPLAALATGPAWLPAPWGEIGQWFPPGAAGTAIRSIAFFDGAGAGRAWLVLLGWVVLGLVLIGLGARRRPDPVDVADRAPEVTRASVA